MKVMSVMFWKDDVINKRTSFVKDLGITCNKVFREIPDGCAYCGKNHIRGVEIYGAGIGVSLWLCDDCEGLLLRYSKSTTEKRLLKASQVYTAPQDWEHDVGDVIDLN